MLRKPAVDKNVKSPVQGAWYTRLSSAALWRALRLRHFDRRPGDTGSCLRLSRFWLALGGFEATLPDLGGSYQARSAAMGLLSIGGALRPFCGHDLRQPPLVCFAVHGRMELYGAVCHCAGRNSKRL